MNKEAHGYTIGLDEVGRGSLAGPVYVAAAMIPVGLRLRGLEGLPKLRDSKKLSRGQRAAWLRFMEAHPDIHFAVSSVGERVIDRINISNAANLAATKAFEKLATKYRAKPGHITKVLLDGGLRISSSLATQNYSLATIIKGDEKIPAISLASIAAKVSRDAFMVRLHARYPRYGFAKHKGYGTALHRERIRKFGPAAVHRRSFRLA